MGDQHRFNTKAWLVWTAGFVAFIIGGALATAATGRINDARSALLGGMLLDRLRAATNPAVPSLDSTQDKAAVQ
jgi:hypothetical protein